MLTTTTRPEGGVPELGGAAAALIAPEESRPAIAAVLEEQGLNATAYDGPEQLEQDTGLDAPAAIVLWADATSPSSLAAELRAIAQRFEAPVVVVSSGIQRRGVRAALASGAAGVVPYDELDSALGPCLLAVLAGMTCVPREHGRQIEPPALSAREKQILSLVVMGYMNSQIAERLFLAESTVKSHLSSAFGKLGVRSRNEAVHLIVDPDGGFGLGILGLGVEPIGPVAGDLASRR